ncbi:MAG: hypothetical protein NTV20_00705 [Candidatus Shapirobacteria bacterium]|nr:hypothetical protein [Candidatus Shapirobacteria bacterium]
MKKWLKITIAIIYLLGVVYLVLPGPVIPNLEPALKSIEPGDTTQMPGVWAYYTDLSREEVVSYYKKAFSRSSFLNIPLPTYILNHPPEYAKENIRDTHQNNFYEEIVQPLRDSLFVSGWVLKDDKVYLARSKQKAITVFTIDARDYNAKITLLSVRSPIWARILIWTGILLAFIIVFQAFKKIIFSPWKPKK